MKDLRTGLFPLFLGVVVAVTVTSLEVDRRELETVEATDIEFESYEGPVDQIDSRDAIRGIGRFLGAGWARETGADYFGRYQAYRAIGDPQDPRRAADIIVLGPSSRVDHIENLRRIVAGFLEEAWGYTGSDADLLARFVTIYNAVHRGDMPFFFPRYREAVTDLLEADRVGLATSYRMWPGQTQLVLPVRDDRERGALDVIDPAQLVDRAVIAELRTRADLGIDDRKAIIEFIERVIEERVAAIEREQVEIEQERAEIIAEREAEEDQPDPREPEPAPEPEPTPDPGLAPERDPDPTADPSPEPDVPTDPEPTPEPDTPAEPPFEPETPAVTELDERDAELERREEDLQQDIEELQELTEQLEELYQETAEDQQLLVEGPPPGELVPFLLVDENGGYELAIVDMRDISVAGTQTIPLADRTVERFDGGLLVVHRNSGRLLLLDVTTLEVNRESDRRARPGSRVRIMGNSILTVVEEGGAAYIGEFDSQLVLVRRSVDPVNPRTDIVVRDEDLLVQSPDERLRVLSLQDVD